MFLERLLNIKDAAEFLTARPGGRVLLCQYPLESFTGTEIMMAIETHTHTIYRGRIRENPYIG